MAEFVVELYAPRESREEVEARAARARSSAEDLAREGASVRFVRSVFVPEDETCFLLYEAGSIETVRAAAELAELPLERVIEAVTVPAPDPSSLTLS